MNKTDIVDYCDIEFVFILDYYDVPLFGLCLKEERLCAFEIYDFDAVTYTIVALTKWQAVCARIDQWLFETCIGMHWTLHPSFRSGPRYRLPEWLQSVLFGLYYKLVPTWNLKRYYE
jgi:hypothetical protein